MLLYWSYLSNMIGVDLSAWTTAFAPSLLRSSRSTSLHVKSMHDIAQRTLQACVCFTSSRAKSAMFARASSETPLAGFF